MYYHSAYDTHYVYPGALHAFYRHVREELEAVQHANLLLTEVYTDYYYTCVQLALQVMFVHKQIMYLFSA
jgi:hypothetical protein